MSVSLFVLDWMNSSRCERYQTRMTQKYLTRHRGQTYPGAREHQAIIRRVHNLDGEIGGVRGWHDGTRRTIVVI